MGRGPLGDRGPLGAGGRGPGAAEMHRLPATSVRECQRGGVVSAPGCARLVRTQLGGRRVGPARPATLPR